MASLNDDKPVTPVDVPVKCYYYTAKEIEDIQTKYFVLGSRAVIDQLSLMMEKLKDVFPTSE